MTETHITTAMRSVVGVEFASSTSFPIAKSDIRRWAVAVYYPDPPPQYFWDDTIDEASPELTAPAEFNPFAWMSSHGPARADDTGGADDPDYQFTILGVEGPGLKFQVNGGMSVTYGVPMKSGDVITASLSIAELGERTGRLGLMLLKTTEAVWTNQDGAEVKRERMTIISY
ncbi:FAS1-like dehydratase domain-containing protein [Rhodococcoides kyotonense]|uniref:N-terminal half of MaoC dehydratase n=1 Tax=Rhodococcoides kyotonense TaxID=398843 RepID=A0A239M1T1_9NOCA|nr:MaoC family dehydratase N-terminal domain-containing protein [Rhodococcus kyotonensis]SNT36631.1 N-terminal half of MaoC dehydratase [Rhodococcus kyotonensis]